eukprot:scaffold18456_cov124-Isochrysis_galbana.AAC.5
MAVRCSPEEPVVCVIPGVICPSKALRITTDALRNKRSAYSSLARRLLRRAHAWNASIRSYASRRSRRA